MKRLTRTLIPLCLCLCMILAMTPTASAYLINSISYPHPVYTIEGDVAYVTGVEWVWEPLDGEEAPIHYDLYIDSTYESYPVVGIKAGALDLYYSNLLVELYIPASVKTVESGAITGKSLATVTFEGDAPEFAEDAFEDASITVYCGHTDAGWTDEVRKNYGGTCVTWQEAVHNYQDRTVTKEPTCTQTGEALGTCSCGQTQTFTVDTLPHTNVNGFCCVCGYDLRFTYTLYTSTTCTVTGFPEGEGTLVIPETINGCTVVSIGSTSAIPNAQCYSGVVIPNTAETIGWYAFKNCTALQELTIGSSVDRIGPDAFAGCTSLSIIAFRGDAPSNISGAVFKNVTADVYYPAGNETWTEDVMVNYGGNLTWDHYCLKHTYNEVITTQPTCTTEGLKTLSCQYCDKVKTEAIPVSDHSYEETITIEPGCNNTGEASYTCTVCGDSYVASLEKLKHSYGAPTVTVEATCTTEGSRCAQCSRCGFVRTVTVAALGHDYQWVVTKEATCLEEGMENQICTRCGDVHDSVRSIPKEHKYLDGICTVCGERGVSLRRQCGTDAYSILYYDGTLEIYGTGAIFDADFENGTWIPGVADEEPTITTLWDDCKRSVQKVIIGDGITEIGAHCFYKYTNLTSVTIADSVTNMKDHAFEGCSSLSEVKMPANLDKIGYSVFRYCSKLTDIEIPQGVTYIGKWAFSSSGLTSITVPSSVTTLETEVFQYCDDLTTAVINADIDTLPSRTFYGCDKLTDVSLPEDLLVIGGAAFRDCISLTTLEIPDTVTTIGDYAFLDCTALTSVTIPASVTTFMYGAFKNVPLTTITFLGSAPTEMYDDTFPTTATTAYYPCNDATWTQEVRDGIGQGNWIWIANHSYVNGECECGASDFLMGDVTADGKLNMGDVAKLFKAVRNGSEIDITVADINGDGKINIGDVAKLFAQVRTNG